MLVIIILFCPTYVSEAHWKQCFILIQRFILRPTVHETGESVLAAFVGLCASICLENEWLAQQFLVHNKASVALAIISNYCCNSKESARNSVKIFFFFPPQDTLPTTLLVCTFSFHFLLELCVRKTSVVVSVLSTATMFTYPFYEFTVVHLTVGFFSFWRESQLF